VAAGKESKTSGPEIMEMMSVRDDLCHTVAIAVADCKRKVHQVSGLVDCSSKWS